LRLPLRFLRLRRLRHRRDLRRLRALRLTALRTLSAHDRGELPREAMVLKLTWATWHRELGELAMDVLGAEAQLRERRARTAEAAGHAARARELARDRYQKGLVDFVTVAETQRQSFLADAARIALDRLTKPALELEAQEGIDTTAIRFRLINRIPAAAIPLRLIHRGIVGIFSKLIIFVRRPTICCSTALSTDF
jgi:hypothetical protein